MTRTQYFAASRGIASMQSFETEEQRRVREWDAYMARLAVEYPVGCPCGESYKTVEAAKACRKCRQYLVDFHQVHTTYWARYQA